MVGSASKSAAKKRGGADSDSTVSITIDDDPRTRKPLSDAKLSQLEAARTKALASRRRKLHDRLQAKLMELRAVLGQDLRPQTVEKVAEAMMKQENSLRAKQARLTEALNDAITQFREELARLRRRIDRVGERASGSERRASGGGTSSAPSAASSSRSSSVRTLSELSSSSSKRLDSIRE